MYPYYSMQKFSTLEYFHINFRNNYFYFYEDRTSSKLYVVEVLY